jgi:hypothetical protein
MAHSIAQSIRLPKKLWCRGQFVFLVTVSLAFPVFAGSPGTWTITGSLNIARAAHTATLLPNGKVLSVGSSDAELYTP